MRRVLALFLVGCAVTGLAACVPPQVASRNLTLSPLFEGVHQTGATSTRGICVTLQRRSTASPALRQWQRTGGQARNGMLVGFRSELRRGADPIPCDEWLFHAAQGKMFFDLSEFVDRSAILRARLTFTLRARDITDDGSESAPCLYQLGSAQGLRTAPLDFALGEAGQIPVRDIGDPVPPGTSTIDVTRTVARWVTGDRADSWLVMSPAGDRPFAEHGEADDVAYCNAYLDDVRLDLDVRVLGSG